MAIAAPIIPIIGIRIAFNIILGIAPTIPDLSIPTLFLSTVYVVDPTNEPKIRK